MAALWKLERAHRARWGDDVVLLNVNDAGTEYGIVTLLEEHPDLALPILQDTEAEQVFARCGGAQFYFYVLDGDRQLVHAHYALAVDGDEGGRLVDEIDALLPR